MGGEQEREGEQMRRKGTICCGCLGPTGCSPQTTIVLKKKKKKDNKRNTDQLSLLQMFRCIQDQEIKTYGLFAFPQWCLHSCVVCPTLIIHCVCLH